MSALHVVFKIDDAEYVLPAADVLQMESYDGATHVPGAPAFVAGIIQVRGRVVPVVDLRMRFGLEAAPRTLDSRVIVAQHQDRTVALLVDASREVLEIAPEQLQAPPQMMTEGTPGFVKAVVHVGKRMLMLVDFGKIIGEEPIHVR
jgi:purine-binding chemotaxis protein CheW